MERVWEPADRPEAIVAFSGGDRVLFVVLGNKRTPCYEVRIVHGPEDVFPPIYHLEWRETDVACADVITGYFLLACVEQASSDYVTVRDASGQQQVTTQLVTENVLRGACGQVGGGR